jgi:16S rRNA (cytidine1402-2'-O)-methyltransferase
MSALASKLFLIPTPLDFGCDETAPITDVLPLAALQAAAQTTHWICENAKSCRAFIKRVGEVQPLALPLQQHTITELPREVHKKGDHGGAFDAKPLLQAALKAAQGANIALVSEAGMPAVADPGSSIVRAAHALGIAVQPFAGPSSLLMALAASGLGGQNFAFVGYLPIDAAARAQRIRELETLARKSNGQGQTQLFIEVPHRNAALWQALLATLKGDTVLSISSGLTLPQAEISSATVADWKHRAAPALGLPCVMGIGA